MELSRPNFPPISFLPLPGLAALEGLGLGSVLGRGLLSGFGEGARVGRPDGRGLGEGAFGVGRPLP